jgi:hypothetical protein
MRKEEVLGLLAVVFFLAILFTEQSSNAWKPLAFGGLIFGVFWFRSK